MEDALVLARTSSRVTVLVRRDRLRASHTLAQRVLAHASIDVRWNTTVAAFDGASERVDRGGGVVDELPTLTSVRLRDAASGVELDEQIVGTAGSVAWAGDATLFYTKFDAAHRPYQVWRHALGSDQAADVLVYEDKADGELRAVVDTAAKGDVRAAEPMAPYRHAQQVGDLGHDLSRLPFCVPKPDKGQAPAVRL